MIEIPWQRVSDAALAALIEEFVLRDGTDYGEHEVDFATKTRRVRQLLVSGRARLVFDPATGSTTVLPCD